MSQLIQKLVAELGTELKKREWKLVTAESCTGGGLAYFITSQPGSSAWFDRGFVTYSNNAKEETLGVKPLTLNVFGAVSEQTAREMAEGALQNSQAQIAVAITGIAGPDGGTPEKPVGTVWFAWTSIEGNTQAVIDIFNGDRAQIREHAIVIALEKLLGLVK